MHIEPKKTQRNIILGIIIGTTAFLACALTVFLAMRPNVHNKKLSNTTEKPQQHTNTPTSPKTPPISPSPSDVVSHIAFSADFANGNGCSSAKDANGCDLYIADISATGDVKKIELVVDTTGVAESFPAWHPTKNIVYYNSQNTSSGTYEQPMISYWDFDENESDTLIPYGAHPSIMPSGSAIIYNDVPRHILKTAPLAIDGKSVSAATALIDGENRFEPTISGDGNLVVFHETSEDNAGASIYNISTQTLTNISPSDGTGHCTINQASTLAVCDQKSGGGLAGVATTSATIGMMSLLVADPTITAISALDTDYADCGFASVNFPNFLDDNSLLVSITCNSRGSEEPTFAKMFIVDIETQTFYPLGKNLAEAYGGSGRSSRTAAVQY